MRASVIILLLLPHACGETQVTAPPPDPVPAGWRTVAAPRPESDAAMCANWAVNDSWDVAIAPRGAGVTIRPAAGEHAADTVAVRGGRLTGFDHGEFGGEVWWEPAGRPRQRIAELNLHGFISTDNGVLGLIGLAHMGINEGQLVRFVPVSDGRWRVDSVADLGAAPEAFARLPGDSVLVATSGALVVATASGGHRVLYRNELWSMTYPTSVARSSSGVIYVGMRSAVARVAPAGGRYQEDWLVPARCSRRLPLGDRTGQCRCAGI